MQIVLGHNNHTDKTIKCNKPDITFTQKKEKITYLIDIVIPNDINIEQKHSEEIEKYVYATGNRNTYKESGNNIKVYNIIPLIISVIGITPRTFKTIISSP